MLQPSPAAPSGSALQFLKVSSAWPRVGSTIGQRLGLDAAGLQVDQEQRDIGIAAGRAGARGDDGEIGDGAIRHRLLHAVERAAGGRSLIACGDGLPLPSNSASVPIASPDGDLRQPFLLLRIGCRRAAALRRRDRRSRRTAPAPARGPFLPRSRRVRDGRRRRRRILRGSRRRESPSRQGPSTAPCHRPPCRPAPRAPLSAGIFRRGISSPRRASAFVRRRNRNSWRVTRVGVGWPYDGWSEAIPITT